MEIDSLWRSAFGDSSARPVLYSSEELNEEGWLPLTDPQIFITNLPNLNHQQLRTTGANNQIAMKSAQDEYLELERQIANIKGKDTIKNPQSLPEPDVFEERKEASLYGYKYETNRPALLHAGIPGLRVADDLTEREKHDVRLFQEPFEQGGFIPKEKEYKAMVAKTKDPKNADGWKPTVDKDGRRLIPKQQTHHDEYNITYVKRNVDENGEIVRPVSPEGSEVPGNAPDQLVNKRLTSLTRTRFGGMKVPPTRDVSEEPSLASTPRGRKRASPSSTDGRDDTPSSKRQKVIRITNGQEQSQSKPKHPNQYTKAREERERLAKAEAERSMGLAPADTVPANTPPAQATVKVTSSSRGSWRDLSPASKRTYNWSNSEPAELLNAIKEDHTWLHEDPAKATLWKNKLLDNQNPVRSLAMYKKWDYWKKTDQAKRPRNKIDSSRDGTPIGNGDSNWEEKPKPKQRTSKARKSRGSAKTTPTPSPSATPASSVIPAPQVAEINGASGRSASPAVKGRAAKGVRGRGGGRESSRQKTLQERKKRNGTPARVDEEASANEIGNGVNGDAQPARRPILKTDSSESTIVVNSGPALSNAGGRSTRSLRSTRRASG